MADVVYYDPTQDGEMPDSGVTGDDLQQYEAQDQPQVVFSRADAVQPGAGGQYNQQQQQQQQHHHASSHPSVSASPASARGKNDLANRRPHAQRKTDYGWIDFTLLTRKEGIARLVQMVCAIITFGAMLDYHSYTEFSAFGFVVAAGIMVFIYVTVLVIATLFKLTEKIPRFFLVRLAGDGLAFFFSFVAGLAGAVKCETKITRFSSEDKLCSFEGEKAEAGVAFAFILSIALLPSIYWSFIAWRDQPSRQGGGGGGVATSV